MPLLGHRHVRRTIKAGHPLAGKKVYIPIMAEGSSEVFAACFRWLGIDAYATPPSDVRTKELGAKYTSGDECYPAKITVGDFLRIIEQPGFDPSRAVFFMPTAEGPCRFGQYAPFLGKVLRDAGYGTIQILSPTSENAYSDLGDVATPFQRGGWRALVCGDILNRALLKTRPYETVPGAAERAYQDSLRDVCETLENSCADAGCQLGSLVDSMTRARDRFRQVPAHYDLEIPLIGIVGEIFCRLNTFSNENLVRKLEGYGAEASLSHIAEWVMYTNAEQARRLRLRGRAFSLEMLGAKVRSHIQRADEHALLAPFHEDFMGYEGPEDIQEVLDLAWPYLPASGALGEMVLSVGMAAYHAKHGADGIIDISPFTCMNGIVSEAIYPKLSKDYGGIPIRNFYFDGTQSDLDRDLGIYLELARSHREKKPYPRHYPAYFAQPVG
jgi:predicted nucleotide-binding protein (sugar kinase/HSP70/actin superfamily)